KASQMMIVVSVALLDRLEVGVPRPFVPRLGIGGLVRENVEVAQSLEKFSAWRARDYLLVERDGLVEFSLRRAQLREVFQYEKTFRLQLARGVVLRASIFE